MNLFEGADPEVVGDAGKRVQMDPESWQEMAYLAVVGVATVEDRFTAEDIWMFLGSRYGDKLARLEAPDVHAMGQVLVRARKHGVCEPTDDFSTAKRKDRHKGPQRIWRSLIR